MSPSSAAILCSMARPSIVLPPVVSQEYRFFNVCERHGGKPTLPGGHLLFASLIQARAIIDEIALPAIGHDDRHPSRCERAEIESDEVLSKNRKRFSRNSPLKAITRTVLKRYTPCAHLQAQCPKAPVFGDVIWESRENSIKSKIMAEKMGFEPTIPFRVYSLSRGAPSTTRPPLR